MDSHGLDSRRSTFALARGDDADPQGRTGSLGQGGKQGGIARYRHRKRGISATTMPHMIHDRAEE